MAARYRNHLILIKANPDAETGFWNVRAHIQFNERITFRDVLITGPKNSFRTQKQAEKHIVQEAKKWVDNRLRELAEKARAADATAET
jgi:hypothetical protein